MICLSSKLKALEEDNMQLRKSTMLRKIAVVMDKVEGSFDLMTRDEQSEVYCLLEKMEGIIDRAIE